MSNKMKIVFLDSGTVGKDIDVNIYQKLGELETYAATPQDKAPERVKDANVIITNKVKLYADVLSAAKNLQLVCITATGYDNVDLEYAKAHGIAVCNVKGYSTDSVAQITVATVLSLVNHLNFYDGYCKSGKYTDSGVHNLLEPVFHEISGKTWGIYGYGNIGKKVADIAMAFGCKVIVTKRTPEPGIECVSLSELFERSDIISVHTPLNDETKHSINAEILAKSKKSLVLVNAARGAVNDENAIYRAVKDGVIGAYGSDVYSVEPMQYDNPIWKLRDFDNVLFTPHMAWGAYEARERLVYEVYENITAFFDGKIRNRVDI